jgi:hypothetical protein
MANAAKLSSDELFEYIKLLGWLMRIDWTEKWLISLEKINWLNAAFGFDEAVNGPRRKRPFCLSYQGERSASSAGGIKPGLSQIAQAGQSASGWQLQLFTNASFPLPERWCKILDMNGIT